MDTEQTFEHYLASKKISPELFKAAEPARYQEWEGIFREVHPESFTAQKKFLINPVRRKYPLAESVG